MREIKFRAWDGKMMVEPVWAWNKSANHYEHYNDFHEKWMYGLETKNVVLMQFTGLLDKNGREIYEGDILQFIFDGKVFHTAPVGWREQFSVWGCMLALSEIEPEDIWVEETTYEVIGNIYENPELKEV